jgi:hypothetical protein
MTQKKTKQPKDSQLQIQEDALKLYQIFRIADMLNVKQI